MFVDKVEVTICAGKGGNGKLSFRHEKFIDRGGPDGGDGGDGGDIIAEASNNQNTLANFRFKKLVKAEVGHDGDKRKKHGKRGIDLIVKLPVGTVIADEEGAIIADLTYDGQRQKIASGGKGGFGNAHFISSTRQAPRHAEKGEPGEEFNATFELKMIADAGLVGLPNAGKSTLLSKISNAHPEIADYPFTTLKPNLGVVDIDSDSTVLFADIPGLIEGASQGKGLGDEFLRHIERTKFLVHVIDAYQENIAEAYKTIIKELAEYSVDLSKRPQIVVINKTEGMDDEMINSLISEVKALSKKKIQVLAISAASGKGLDEFLYLTKKLVEKSAAKEIAEEVKELPIIKLADDNDAWQVAKKGKKYYITGNKIERFAHRTDFENYESVDRLKDIMRKMGISHELDRKGINVGDEIYFTDKEIGPISY